MKTISDIKREIFAVVIRDPSAQSKYGMFLDKMVFDDDRRGKDPDWDLWYFSDNSDFCRESAKFYLDKVNEQLIEYEKISEAIERDQLPRTSFEFKKLRRLMGTFFFYLCSSLESFAHEINIFYQLGKKRKDVSLFKIQKVISSEKSDNALCLHMKDMEALPVHRILRTYRNAFAHGYVFPLAGENRSIFVSDHPQGQLFSFDSSTFDLGHLVANAFRYMERYICNGYRCFEKDELTEQSVK